jgi:hypothetical protein
MGVEIAAIKAAGLLKDVEAHVEIAVSPTQSLAD